MKENGIDAALAEFISAQPTRWYFNIVRPLRYWWQRRIRGWDDSDTWSLDLTAAKWFAPRLRRFKELNNGFPHGLTEEKWDATLDQMIEFCEWYVEHSCDCYDEDEWKAQEKKGVLIYTHFRDLWW